jgi:glycerol kinase
MQFQSDILGVDVERPEIIESTAQGSAYMAGIYVGLWKKEDIIHNRKINAVFEPGIKKENRDVLYAGWQKAVKRTMNWSKT